MRILITGGAGFIGSHMTDRMISDGHQVVAIDNLITGNINNIAHHIGNDNFKFIKYDVTEFLHVEEDVDWILHFASPASPIDYAELPIQTLKVGAMGTHKALGLCIKKKASFLISSTSEVYGDPLENPQTESYWGNVNPVGPRGVYDEAKRFAEAMTMAYHRVHNISVRIARIFNTFGPRMRAHDGRVIPAFINQALKNEPITIFGGGTQTRSFCFVSDMVEGLNSLIQADVNEPVNVGNPNEMSILQLAELIIELTNSRSTIVNMPLPEDDPQVRRPDISKAKDVMGWEPKVTTRDGLITTIEHFDTLFKEGK